MRRVVLVSLVCVVFALGVPIQEAHAQEHNWIFSPVRIQVTDNGDGDGIADTNETLQIGISLRAVCFDNAFPWSDCADQWLIDCTAWLSTDSPAIDCMRRSEVLVGDLPGTGLLVTPVERFEIKIGNIDRHDLGLGPDALLEAPLMLDLRCVDISDSLWFSESFALPLDLNVSDLGQTPIAWKEDFEAGGTNPSDPFQGTAFVNLNLDEGLPGNNAAEGLLNADGWRCQYSDPDWHNAGSYNHLDGEICYPAQDLAHANAVFWQVDGLLVPGTPDGGRAYRGDRSMYYGVFLGLADEGFTTPMSTVEAAVTDDLINLGVGNPQLSFWHQVSLTDHRRQGTKPRRSLDRGVAQIRLFDSDGSQISDWMTLQAIQNSHDEQAQNGYSNCTFDPVDDGNNEDDFFDPTDPSRKYGPSSTCAPTLSWAWMGSTTGAFSTADIGHATVPPSSSDEPSLGVGTWIETKVDLSEFRGRRAKLRYLVTSIKVVGRETWRDLPPDRDETDDGWWIDEIEITETLPAPATFANDLFLLGSCTGNGEPCIGQCRSSLAPCSDAVPCGEGTGDCVIPCPPGEVCAGPPPDCGANCSQAQVNLFVEPNGPFNPASLTKTDSAEPVEVNLAAPVDPGTGAEPSWVDVCVDGFREYRACISGDPDGDLSGTPDADCDDPWDSPACETCPPDWSLQSAMLLSPDVVTTYAVELRCSSAPLCRNGRTLEIVVQCPFGAPNTYGLRDLRAFDKEMLTWRGPLDVDWLRGSFLTGEEIGDYVADFTDGASYATAIPMDGDPPAGSGYYYLVKADGPANTSNLYYCATKTWRSGGTAEMLEPARNNAFGNP